jgi:predicted NBD/HSP70 family sugar kinase
MSESLAGGEALAATLSTPDETLTFDGLVQKAVEAEGQEREALRYAAGLIGEALGTIVTLLNPRLIIISGRHFGDPPDDVAAYRVIVDPIREGMQTTGFPAALEDVDIALGKSPAFAAAEGGIVAVLRRLLPSYLEQRV